jgi:hypothetical protein
MAKPGRKLRASIRMAHMCEPSRPALWPGVDWARACMASFAAKWATKKTTAKLPAHMPRVSK